MDQAKKTNHQHSENDGSLKDEELDNVWGGFHAGKIQLCTRCGLRVAVEKMSLCAVCFRERHLTE